MFDKMIHFPKTPSDAELEAERDRKHAAEVAWWLEENKDLGMPLCDNPECNHIAADHDGGRCHGLITDYGLHYECTCVRFEKDPDDE